MPPLFPCSARLHGVRALPPCNPHTYKLKLDQVYTLPSCHCPTPHHGLLQAPPCKIKDHLSFHSLHREGGAGNFVTIRSFWLPCIEKRNSDFPPFCGLAECTEEISRFATKGTILSFPNISQLLAILSAQCIDIGGCYTPQRRVCCALSKMAVEKRGLPRNERLGKEISICLFTAFP